MKEESEKVGKMFLYFILLKVLVYDIYQVKVFLKIIL